MSSLQADYQRHLQKSATECVIRHKRDECIYLTHLNWVTRGEGKAVPKAVGNQGLCSSCWAWCAVEASYAALVLLRPRIGGYPRLAVQDVMDRAYPEETGCHGGEIITALEWIRRNGVCESRDYRPYTGVKATVPPPRPRRRHYINGWKVIEDEENAMLEVLKRQPIIVSIPEVSGVIAYKGGLLDLKAAEERHQPHLYPHRFDPNNPVIRSHTVLLIGYGSCYSYVLNVYIYNWIVKNQWDEEWGKKGYGFIIRNSSLTQLRGAVTREEIERATHYYCPIIPVVSPKGEVAPQVDLVQTMDPNELYRHVIATNFQHLDLIVLFYSPGYVGLPRLLEDFRLVSAAYEHDSNAKLIKIDTSVYPFALQLFGVQEPVTLMSFEAKAGGGRCVHDGMRLPQNIPFTFHRMLKWLGSTVGVGI